MAILPFKPPFWLGLCHFIWFYAILTCVMPFQLSFCFFNMYFCYFDFFCHFSWFLGNFLFSYNIYYNLLTEKLVFEQKNAKYSPKTWFIINLYIVLHVPTEKKIKLENNFFSIFLTPKWSGDNQELVNFESSEWKFKNCQGDAICIGPRYLPLPHVRKLVKGCRLKGGAKTFVTTTSLILGPSVVGWSVSWLAHPCFSDHHQY